jgi:enoyl-CoA hydratase/carnithine racemase
MLRAVSATVRYKVDGAVATLTLDRPDRLNAITAHLEGALDRAEADAAVRAIRSARDAPFGDYGQAPR